MSSNWDCPIHMNPYIGSYIPSTIQLKKLIIDRVALAKQGDNRIGSVRPSVSQSTLSRLNRLTFDLDIWHGCRP